ncbi:MAG: family peptidase [Nevskia sp.]|nr:family peptidase [Nevskia sp.]
MLGLALGACLFGACSKPAEAPAKTDIAAAAAAPTLASGVDLQFTDDAVRAQDDFYKHINGKWLATTEIPADKGVYGSFSKLDDDAQEQLKTLIEGLGNAPTDADAQKIDALYASFLDEPKLEELGLKPVAGELAKIDAIKDKKEIPALIAHLNQISVGAPYEPAVHLDAKDSTKYIVDLGQAGLGLPDRDYYLKDDDKLKDARGKYATHIEAMLKLAGDKNAAKSAKDIVALETELAKIQWSKVENRDPVKTYNKVPLADLPKLMAAYDWKSYLTAAGVDGKLDYVIVSQPTYFSALGKLLQKTPLPVLKTYFKWRLLSAAAPFLSKPFVDERFAFYGTSLRGIPQNRPRWKRGVALVDDSIGEGLGKLYVEKYFPPESKARMQALVQNLIAAYRSSIETLDWMGPDTKKAAQEKLNKLMLKIGYPDKWRDYSKLTFAKDDLVGNVERASEFEYQRNIDKLGQPIDRSEWEMTPQTVNAYYNPEMNEIVFPAAILQPPFFNVKADDAVNYGGIGAVIGHEISHGFDDQGSQYDADGNLRDWFTKDDHDKFKAKTQALVAQYSAYEPVPGFHVNGELTLGENIADNSGLAIAYKAYKISLNGKDAPLIDGLTGPQRLFAGWAQVWRGKVRENEAVVRIKSDPHSPPAVRGDAPLVNQPGFYDAFGLKEGDKMYLPPEQRVSIW